MSKMRKRQRIALLLPIHKKRVGRMNGIRYKKIFWQAVKIAVGSSFAVFLAGALQLQFAASAGSITLLTIVTTKWETIKLSLYRVLSFGVSVILAGILFQTIRLEWVGYGLYIFLLVLVCEFMEWKAAISVNAVIGLHFLTEKDFSYEFIRNEFFLVVTGITIAVVLNLFHGNSGQKAWIILHMREVEERMGTILRGLAAYLDNRDAQQNVQEDIRQLEENLHKYIAMANDYQGNTFHSHPEYYISYFQLRLNQCRVMRKLHSEMSKIREIPKQAKAISKFIRYLTVHVTEMNVPTEQISRLNAVFRKMEYEPLPKSRKEFVNRAILYHVLMDLEEFLILKKRFVESLDEKKLRIYWGRKHKKSADG